MELFVFLDLDDTIFQTRQKCPTQENLTAAAFLKDGSANSFFTQKQYRLFNILQANTRLIPTTARNYDAFYRAQVQQFDYAIINHGGIILHTDGSVHNAWFEQMQNLIDDWVLEGLQRLKQNLEAELGQQHPFRIRLIEDFGLTFYLLIKHSKHDNLAVERLCNEIMEPFIADQELDFYCHLNGNNLAVLPTFLTKATAVRFLKQQLEQQYGDYISFGMGDSLTDISYMQLCDYFITPKNSQIVQECINPHKSLVKVTQW